MALAELSPYDALLQRVDRLEHENIVLYQAIDGLKQELSALKDKEIAGLAKVGPIWVDTTRVRL